MNIQTPSEYCRNKEKRESLFGVINPDGSHCYIANGVKLTLDEVNQFWPLSHKVKAYNPDK